MTVALTVAAYHAATMSSPVSPSRLHLAFQGLRLRLRGSDLWFIALALLVGLIAGYLTLLQSGIARWLQGTLYGLDDGMRLSSLPSLTWTALLVLPLGGLLVGLVSLAATRLKRPLLDAVEANALHGGRNRQTKSFSGPQRTSGVLLPCQAILPSCVPLEVNLGTHGPSASRSAHRTAPSASA